MYHRDTYHSSIAHEERESDCWSAAKATTSIRAKANDPELRLAWTGHAKVRMQERDLIMSDVLHVLRQGFVLEDGEPTSREGFYKYKMESVTPNSHGRTVCAVVIPNQSCVLKIVTLMWKDER